jgi:hypothetical protein
MRFVLFTLCLLGLSCSMSTIVTPTTPTIDISQQNLRTNLEFLASDELEGREAGTRGEKLAALYLRSQLEHYGIRPFALQKYASDSVFSFFQNYEAAKIALLPGSAVTLFDSTSRKETRLSYGEYFSNFHEYLFPVSFQAPLVFAGYGITAPEYNHDDYANLDVKGKIVIVIDGEPASDDMEYFSGSIATYYSSTLFYKRHRAQELGARGMISLAYPQLLDKWADFIDYFKSSILHFGSTSLFEADSTRMPFYYCGHEMMRQLLSSQAFPYDSITSRIETGRPLPVFPLKGISGRIRVNTAVQDVRAMNVIGFIPGTDPNLKNEVVAIGAHFDHLGVDGDGQVYNGADDDGSGTVAVLEAARVLNALKQNRRSILVVFHGAEEKGLIGSEFLTDTTTENAFQMSQIVAQINVDMVGREHVDSLYVIGAGRLSSEMERLVVEVNREDSLFHFNYEFDREDDPNQFYSRSDHYNYARHRIPIVFFFDGMKEDYHKTSDDVEKIDFRKIEKVTRLITRLALRIANRDARLPVDRGHTSGTE